MFKNYVFRRQIASTFLVAVLATASIPSYAVNPPSGGGSVSGAQAALTAVMLAALQAALLQFPDMAQEAIGAAAAAAAAMVAVPVVEVDSAAAAANPPQDITPVRPRTRAPLVDTTPDGYRRINNGPLFGTPNTLEAESQVYGHFQVDPDFQRIDLQYQRITQAEARAMLLQHPQFHNLRAQVEADAPIYAGKTNRNGQVRGVEHVRNARNGKDTRHYNAINAERLRFVRSVFVNVHPEDLAMIETLVIHTLRANEGQGCNSNAGSKRRTDSEEKCSPNVKRMLRFDRDARDDDSSDGFDGSGANTPEAAADPTN